MDIVRQDAQDLDSAPTREFLVTKTREGIHASHLVNKDARRNTSVCARTLCGYAHIYTLGGLIHAVHIYYNVVYTRVVYTEYKYICLIHGIYGIYGIYVYMPDMLWGYTEHIYVCVPDAVGIC